MESPEPEIGALAVRARRAYERGRLARAALGVVPLLPIMAIAALFGDGLMVLWLSGPLVVLSLGCLFIGRGLERAVRPGWSAGFVPLFVALATLQRFGCASGGCAELCAPLCAGAGMLVGAWLGTTMQARERLGVAAASLLIAGLTASLGCAAIGASTLVGAVVGLSLGLVPVWVVRGLASSRS
ncbi:MAG: hypothetical protein K0V04_15210 [Deltaproteobacteria bacterium]|nr:hypothetical protein [Deltaproteobacteria bacterium]